MSTGNMTGWEGIVSRVNFGFDEILRNPLLSVSSVLLLIISLVVFQRWNAPAKKPEKGANLPPGPKGLPILGVMLQVAGDQKHRILWEVSKKYGALFNMRTGSRDFVTVMTADLAYESLVQKHQIFSTRPNMVSRLNFLGNKSVNSAFYGSYWRDVRKNLVTQVLNSSRVVAFKPFRELELKNLIDRVKDDAKKNDNVVPVLPNLRHTVFAILIHVLCGTTFNQEQVLEVDYILKRLLYLLKPQPEDFLPFIQIFTKKHKNECQALAGRLRKLFGPYVDEHRKRRQSNPGAPTFDYIDSLLMLQEKIGLGDNDILGLMNEMLAGGADTTAATIQWSMAFLIQYPEIQERLYEEIKRVAGDRQVQEEDIEKMPYMQAVVKEALRIKPPLPLGLVHGLTESATLGGFDIPKETVVLYHYQAMGNDPQRWENPTKFDPERFLSPNPNYDMTGSHGPRSLDFVPFGAGRRICPGMELGLKHVHLILSTLMQTFQWSTVKPGQDVDFNDVTQFTLNMVTPLYSRIKERSME